MACCENSVCCGNARVRVLELAAVHDRIFGILPSLECKSRRRGSRPRRPADYSLNSPSFGEPSASGLFGCAFMRPNDGAIEDLRQLQLEYIKGCGLPFTSPPLSP